ncbi:NAD(P)H-dependent oxidoreductase [Desulfovibrio sp. OttesenSCG-928-A18]|nr:NAD(P)H-dependent oxidoreductase [Desulfovibrio sp. OttesenSCG-928-A18]
MIELQGHAPDEQGGADRRHKDNDPGRKGGREFRIRPAIALERYLLMGCSPRPGGNSDTALGLFSQSFERTILLRARAGSSAPDGRSEPEPLDERSSNRLRRTEGPGGTKGPAQAADAPCCAEAGAALSRFGLRSVFLRDHRVLPCVGCDCCKEMTEALVNGGPPYGFMPFGCPLTAKDDSAALLRSFVSARGLCLVAPIYFYHLPAGFKGLLDRMQPFWNLHAAGGRHLAEQPERVCRVILLGARKKGQKLFEGALLTLRHAFAPLRVRLAEPLLLRGLDGPEDLRRHEEHRQAIMDYAEDAAHELWTGAGAKGAVYAP